MSYILDALAKADAERRHSSGTPVTAAVHQPAPKRASGGRRWWTAVAILFVAAVAALAWLQRSQPNAPVAPRHIDAPPASAPASASAPAAANSGTAETAAPGVAAVAPEPTPAPAPLPRGDATPLPILAPAPPTPGPTTPVARAANNTPPAAANTTAAPPTGATLPRPPANAPALAISGATYSDNPAHRLLIVNGKVVQEGQEVAPGVRLEAIGPRSAVFNQGGTRFNINHQ